MRISTAVSAALVSALAASATHAETFNLTFASGYGDALAWTDEELKTFLPEVNKLLEASGSEHRVEWTTATGGTLTSMANMMDAMSSGLADVGHIAHVFEPVRLPLQNVPSVVPFGTEDPELATLALHELNKTIPAMQEAWTRQNLVYLTSFSFDSYLLVMTPPVDGLDDLDGLKIAAAASNLPWLDGTGAIGVTGTSATIYSDIKSGVMDGAINSAMLAQPGKLHEVAPHIVQTGFGAINAFELVANKDSWDRLPEEVQTAIMQSADQFQAKMIARIKVDSQAALDAMEADGATITRLSDEDRAAWVNGLPNIAMQWVERLEAEGLPAGEVLRGYIENLEKGGANLARDWLDNGS